MSPDLPVRAVASAECPLHDPASSPGCQGCDAPESACRLARAQALIVPRDGRDIVCAHFLRNLSHDGGNVVLAGLGSERLHLGRRIARQLTCQAWIQRRLANALRSMAIAACLHG